MSQESQEKPSWDYTKEPTVIIGGCGELGTRVADGLRRGLGIHNLVICDIGDPIQKVIKVLVESRIAFFATEENVTVDILKASIHQLHPNFTVIEGGSTKGKVTPLLETLDESGRSAASVHLGIKTDNSWAGARLWRCRVGPNSGKALLLATDLFSYFNTNIIPIELRDHQQVQLAQVHTFVTQLAAAAALRNRWTTIQKLDQTSTVNAQLAALSVVRGLGQSKKIIAEILNGQTQTTEEIIDSQIKALKELKTRISGREELEEYIEGLQNFHGEPIGALQKMFADTSLLIPEILRIGLPYCEYGTTVDTPGTLERILEEFADEGVNLLSISSRRDPPSREEVQQGADARQDKVYIRISADKATTDPDTERVINRRLKEIGFDINEK